MQKTEVPGVYKVREGVLINNDSNALSAYKKQKKKIGEIDNIKEDISELKKDLSEIKELLKGLAK